MNAIQCRKCWDILVPNLDFGIQTCLCGHVQIKPVENKDWIVEVSICPLVANPPGEMAQVIKINNHFLYRELGPHEFYKEQGNDLFVQNNSQIVIAPLDTPGVKVVKEWSKKTT